MMDRNVVGVSDDKKMKYEVNGEEFAIKLLEYFEKCYKSGEKNIGVSSTHYYSHQQKLIILGLSYFNLKYPHLKVGIVSFSCDASYFREFKNSSKEILSNAVYNYQNHFDLISWQYLLDTHTTKAVGDSYDVLIWELPEIQFLSNHSHTMKESLEAISSLFIISNRLKGHDDDDFLQSIAQYFLNHGVNISHLLPLKKAQGVKVPKKRMGVWPSVLSRLKIKSTDV